MEIEITPIAVAGLDAGLMIARATERLLGAVIGATSIFLGYRLFLHLPQQTDSEGRIVLPGGISIWLSRVGPGVFFLLFGTALIALSLSQRLSIESKQSIDSQESINSTSTLVASPATIAAKRVADSDPVRRKSSAFKGRRANRELPVYNDRNEVNAGAFRESHQNMEKKVSFSNSQLPDDQLHRQASLRAEARKTIADLAEIQGILHRGDEESNDVSFEIALQKSKLAILKLVWGEDWGEFDAFRNWIDKGALPPVPKSVGNEAIEIYKASHLKREGK